MMGDHVEGFIRGLIEQTRPAPIKDAAVMIAFSVISFILSK